MFYLFPSVDDVLREGETSNTWASDHTVMSRGSVGHLHGRELEETLAQSYPTQQQLSGNIERLDLEASLL